MLLPYVKRPRKTPAPTVNVEIGVANGGPNGFIDKCAKYVYYVIYTLLEAYYDRDYQLYRIPAQCWAIY